MIEKLTKKEIYIAYYNKLLEQLVFLEMESNVTPENSSDYLKLKESLEARLKRVEENIANS